LISLSSNQVKGHLAMLAFSGLVAGSFALGVRVANDISPAAFTLLRFVVAVSILGTFILSRGPIPKAVFIAPWRYFILGACISIYFVLMFEGLRFASSISLAAIFTFAPLLSGFFGFVLMRQKMTIWIFFGLIIGAFGALYVIFNGDLARLFIFDFGIGEAIFFIGVIFHALYTPLARKLNRGEKPIIFVLMTTSAALVLVSVYGFSDLLKTDLFSLPSMVWKTIFYTAILASVITFFLIQFATLVLPSSKVMAYTYLVPPWALVWELSLGSNNFSQSITYGIIVTAMALLILLWAPEGE
jgi:drug/metabolite transporter (DMT)-like permease